MREIKFRAWDKNKKCFLEKVPTLNLTLGHFNVNGYDWSQFTGLKDKNGVEIYEGDIVTTGATVEWSEKSCGFIVRMKDFSNLEIPASGMRYEVIGNIYQNPELLK